ncbi:aspartyl-tRNA synthetase [Caldanaerobius fijiensis DSM 17918]|uniref:Aspartate--tRNA ligase n=1 Tax=Caldanaerobius fijiensis DSM 17918 TaxID=1121256 RepID=A0A1M4TZG3_9THEO|nr:aspartate--tRNA ligase [Caldanaerobius fijiensis]SHE49737.1 aspartyl-tRNA synthetase [Caldanaerobius fijiensis DSM 17918]
MGELLSGLKRTHMCGLLTENEVGREAVVMGWVQRRRDLGGLIFIDLRDRTGIVQVVFDQSLGDVFRKAEKVRNEYVLAVIGDVVKRDEETYNPNISTGTIEIRAKDLKILSVSDTPPFMIEDDVNVSESVRLKYRYLDLRRPKMQNYLITRSKVAKIVRDYLIDHGFLEIETPYLTKSTPEGARDFLVPSRLQPGTFYALPQSPQLFKQLLMIAGYDRYFQLARCFRDEDLRADRQPDFTQIDIEMSFIEEDDVIELNEGLLKKVFGDVLGIELKTPFLRLTYQEAMERFGSDKPDLRFGMELKDLSDILKETNFNVFRSALSKGSIRAINAEGCGEKFSRREIDALVDLAKDFGAKGLAWISIDSDGPKSPILKFLTEEEINGIIKRLNAKPGDLLLIVADEDAVVFNVLGRLRLHLGRKLGLMKKDDYKFVWVVDFPLLEWNEEEHRYTAMHHPFTAPKDEDIPLLDSQPQKVRAKAYDIVLNGVELGGGSIRIHSTDIQEKMFKVLGFTNESAWERFGFLMEAFKYGAPPHGGIAYGFDRLIMLLTGTDNIRDVIAFPKTQNGSCLLTDAPSPVDLKQLRELHIKVDI